MKDFILSIVNIFKWVGKLITMFRNTVINILFLALFFLLVISLLTKQKVEVPMITSNTGLILNLSGNIVEEKEDIGSLNEFIDESMGFENPYQEVLLQDILDAINHAATDQNISYLQLDLKQLGAIGLPQMNTIGKALTNFKKRGKKVIAAEDYYTQSQYYLASYANEVILNPMGGVDLHGFGVYRLYFKEALDKLKINYHIFKVGSYKSALEPITRNNMSEADKEQNQAWLNALWTDFSNNIILQRRLKPNAIENYTNQAPQNLMKVAGNTAKMALNAGLVDKLMTRVELDSYLKHFSKTRKNKKRKTITMNEYLSTFHKSYTDNTGKANIGVIIAQGMILPGEQPPGTIGGDTLATILRKARQNNSLKAVVLRINSGGGSAFASEIIRQELLALKAAGKKLVVSMGNVAASGGYWIATPADEIWASPTTITGSIGIFGAIPTFENSLSDIGVFGDGVGTTDIASGLNITQPLSQDIAETVQLSVQHGYNTFLNIVAEGRGLELSEVKKLAEGRVYDGVQAKTIGLVDYNGDLDDAIESAADLAGIQHDYSAVYLNTPISITDKILKKFGKHQAFLVNSKASHPLLSMFYKIFAPVKDILLLKDPHGVYAHSLLFERSITSSIQ